MKNPRGFEVLVAKGGVMLGARPGCEERLGCFCLFFSAGA